MSVATVAIVVAPLPFPTVSTQLAPPLSSIGCTHQPKLIKMLAHYSAAAAALTAAVAALMGLAWTASCEAHANDARGAADYTGFKVYRLVPQTEAQLRRLARLSEAIEVNTLASNVSD